MVYDNGTCKKSRFLLQINKVLMTLLLVVACDFSKESFFFKELCVFRSLVLDSTNILTAIVARF